MAYRVIELTDSQWDTFVRQHPRGHFLQLNAWGKLKSEYGWYPVRVTLANDQGEVCAGSQVLLRRLPLRLGTLAYIPYAPLIDWQDSSLISSMMQALQQLVKKHRAVFLKIEPGYAVPLDVLRQQGFAESSLTIQPPNTVLIDLDDEENILKRMNQGTRRNIRKSEKSEVVIREGTRADVDSFTAMMNETGDRQEFGVHVPKYYGRAYELFVPSGDAVLLMASYQDVDLAGVFVFKVGKSAWYQYGASRDVERQRMAAFGVQWAGITWALAQGCTVYDMVGIPDEHEATLEAGFETRHDGLWGVYRFKRGWGGRVARTVGAWDKIYNRPLYLLYQLALRWRRAATD